MFDDEDYGFLTGGLGDLDGDGRVDFEEYLNEEDEFQRIMGIGDDGYSISGDEDTDDDWEMDNLDTADKYGLSVFDYTDEEEFLEAVEEARENSEWKEYRAVDALEHNLDLDDFDNEEDFDQALEELEDEAEDDEAEEEEDEDEDEDVISFSDFDISKLSLTIGAKTSLDYDGKPIDEVFGKVGKAGTADEISPEEYKKLKNENKSLKSQVTQLKKRINDLTYNVQQLETALYARQNKPVWDGKYYRYCQVQLDESPNPLWYRTDDRTIKKGDFVYVPYGYKNQELPGQVVLVEDFRSDELPFPLERTKFIGYKYEE